jgi:hypothetical protein
MCCQFDVCVVVGWIEDWSFGRCYGLSHLFGIDKVCE